MILGGIHANVLAPVVVACGGALGAVLRWLAIRYGKKLLRSPIPTLLINCAGSLALGWLAARDAGIVALGLGTGVLGGFTTFSTFAVEAAQLYEAPERRIKSMVYVAVTLFASAAFAAAGWVIGTGGVST
ncbi:fluoride efflux transporter FluC [Paenibacillus thermotolerans]|uniref:fluoride efflux transporter FluC n=1 Tax=Paenibacillus thermotolerans TaxID=3027807 RepID=UPI002368E572|nr:MULTISPECIES: CrcB family protein [unclassified Paenibacillus]